MNNELIDINLDEWHLLHLLTIYKTKARFEELIGLIRQHHKGMLLTGGPSRTNSLERLEEVLVLVEDYVEDSRPSDNEYFHRFYLKTLQFKKINFSLVYEAIDELIKELKAESGRKVALDKEPTAKQWFYIFKCLGKDPKEYITKKNRTKYYEACKRSINKHDKTYVTKYIDSNHPGPAQQKAKDLVRL